MRKKRKLFDELMEGFDALADQRAGKRTLRTHAVKSKRVHAGELFQSQADHASLRGLLERLDVPQERIDLELAAMHPVRFARATNRRVLGSMNDFAFQARHYLARGDDLVTIADCLAHTPMSAIGEAAGHLGLPDMLARALLAGGVA